MRLDCFVRSHSFFRRRSLRAAVAAACLALAGPWAVGQVTAPAGFQTIEMSPALTMPVAMAFAPDGRIFVAERAGVVKVIQNGSVISTFIDLTAEVNCTKGLGDRGLLGLALDPNFLTNRRVYLLYAVDPIAGQPDEGSDVSTFCRLTRYAGTAASNGNIADAATRTVLIGSTAATGFPQCWRSHSTGALRWGADGSLLVSHGESALYGNTDPGGLTPSCFAAGLNDPAQDVGAFRAQMLDSMGGKILRIDPDTGNGMRNNPYYSAAAPASPRSRVWLSGLRNPFRFAVRPGTGGASTPGTIYVGDVGNSAYEEISIAASGGGNFGWPCREGSAINSAYTSLNPPQWGCATIGTAANPGPLIAPAVSLNHANALQSTPQGITSLCLIGGVFHAGPTYPSPWRGGFFFADHINSWIKVLRTDANNQVTGIYSFGDSPEGMVDFAVHPPTGDVCVLTMFGGKVWRLHSLIKPGDVTRNGVVNTDDLLSIIGSWGPCPNPLTCPADLDVNGTVNTDDLLEVITNWG